RTHAPPAPGGPDLGGPVGGHARPGAAPPRADDVDARMSRGVLGKPLGRDVFDRERAAREVVDEEAEQGLVLPARRVACRNPDQTRSELIDLVSGALDFGKHTVDGL